LLRSIDIGNIIPGAKKSVRQSARADPMPALRFGLSFYIDE